MYYSKRNNGIGTGGHGNAGRGTVPSTAGNFGGGYPKRPLHSFQDLEVYQKALECSVLVVKEIAASISASDIARAQPAKSPKGRKGTGDMPSMSGNVGSGIARELLIKNMLVCALAIPHQVAEAHSLRFGDHAAGIAAIERAMLNCNKMVVYLEQFRDICDTGIPWEFFDDAIKKYVYVRRKMLRLEQAWKKFMPEFKRAE